MSSSQSPDPGRRVVDEDLADLFEEAPVAYVHEDMDTRFIRANRAAREILGISAEEVSRTIGISLVVDTPEAKQNVRDALERLHIGGRTDIGS
jgi:PAS domain S-box-containing protein